MEETSESRKYVCLKSDRVVHLEEGHQEGEVLREGGREERGRREGQMEGRREGGKE